MNPLRERLAAALQAHTLLADSPGDRRLLVGSLARADPLGAALVRTVDAGDFSSGQTAFRWLMADIRLRFNEWPQAARARRRGRAEGRRSDPPSTRAPELAALAIAEFLSAICAECHGRKQAGGEQYLVTRSWLHCKPCAGFGFARVPVSHTGGTWTGWPRIAERPCRQCSGKGMVEALRTPAPEHACRACRGTGRARIDHEARRRALGIDRAAYERSWERVCDDVLQLLDQRYGEALPQIRAQLRDGRVADSRLQSAALAATVAAHRRQGVNPATLGRENQTDNGAHNPTAD